MPLDTAHLDDALRTLVFFVANVFVAFVAEHR
jgi:hypothetical protein